MFRNKIENQESGILLYGITPPKSQNSEEKIDAITEKTINRIQKLNIDGLVVYDLQDESSRNPNERPFPFFQTIDAFTYSNVNLKNLAVEKIVYCSVGKLSEEQLLSLLKNNSAGNSTVFVGVPSKEHPIQLPLSRAYDIWKQANLKSYLGAVAIPERHCIKKNEHLKLVHKMESGCRFFITQCVYNIEYVKNLISDVYFYSQQHNTPVPTLIFTITPCGSLKTLKFLDWLGIHVPDWLTNELSNSQDILKKSVDLCIKIAREIIDFCQEKNIPFGLNIESVSIRKEEIEASEALLRAVTEILETKGIRTSLTEA
mgnify:CR=1 FL=1